MACTISARVDFLMETEKLKSVLRRTQPAHLDRQENSAEHSWSLAVMAILFHDLVENHAGDTFCYDLAANADKAAREQCAADVIFGCLPTEQRGRFRSLWEEFESAVTAEARFANALDRLLPLLQHRSHRGAIWKAHGIAKPQVLNRIAPVASISKGLHAYACGLVEESARSGWLAES